jgi:hypothetical protein
VFYIARRRAEELGIEAAVQRPLVRSPRQVGGERILVDVACTPSVALVVPPGRGSLARYPAVARYLRSMAGASERPTLRSREYWWALPVRPARLFLTKSYASRFVQRVAPVDVIGDQRVYVVRPREVEPLLLGAVLNATFTAFALESLGRASLGEGALEWTVSDAQALPVIDPRGFDQARRKRLISAFSQMLTRPVRSVGAEALAPDRRALDECVLTDLVAGELDGVHSALVSSVDNRARRARATLLPSA